MIPTLRQSGARRRRARGYNLPFAVDNLLALDAAAHYSITDAGGAVSLWEDIGPSGRDFGGGVAPDHNAANNIVNFNGSDDYLTGGSGLLPETGDFTLVVRFEFTGGRNNTLAASHDDALSPTPGVWAADVLNNTVPRFYIGARGGKAQLTLQGSALSAATQHTLTVTRSGHVFTLRTDGTQRHQLTDTGALREAYTGFVRIGVRFSVNYLLGGIVRFGVWGQAFTGGDLTTIEDWASNGG